jgi:polyisoprenoid-binding protein YceI
MSTLPIDPQPGTAQAWRLDPTGSSVEFQVPHFWGLITVKGHFHSYEGSLTLGDAPAVKLTIDAASLHTGSAMRDKHLRAADFFDVTRHPQVTFVSDSVSRDGGALRVNGTLRAGGGEVPLEIDGTLTSDGDADMEIEATAHVDQRTLGMTWSPLGVTRTPATLIVKGRLVSEQ